MNNAGYVLLRGRLDGEQFLLDEIEPRGFTYLVKAQKYMKRIGAKETSEGSLTYSLPSGIAYKVTLVIFTEEGE